MHLQSAGSVAAPTSRRALPVQVGFVLFLLWLGFAAPVEAQRPLGSFPTNRWEQLGATPDEDVLPFVEDEASGRIAPAPLAAAAPPANAGNEAQGMDNPFSQERSPAQSASNTPAPESETKDLGVPPAPSPAPTPEPSAKANAAPFAPPASAATQKQQTPSFQPVPKSEPIISSTEAEEPDAKNTSEESAWNSSSKQDALQTIADEPTDSPGSRDQPSGENEGSADWITESEPTKIVADTKTPPTIVTEKPAENPDAFVEPESETITPVAAEMGTPVNIPAAKTALPGLVLAPPGTPVAVATNNPGEEGAVAPTPAKDSATKKLDNPFSPRNLLQWVLDHGPRLLLILVAMYALRMAALLFSQRIVEVLARGGARGSHEEREDRARTLMGVFHNAASIVIVVGSILMACEEVGIAVGPLMGGAAVLGLAAAFGTQNLIRDYFHGFMILLENQYKLNDIIKVGDISGQVERITMRVTILRDLEGNVHFVPNGRIESVTNMTHGWSRALLEVRIGYNEDADRVMGILIDLADELRHDPNFAPLILDDAEMLGVDSLGESALVVKFTIKTRPLKQWAVRREMLRRIKHRFDELNIQIPGPRVSLSHDSGTRLAESASHAARPWEGREAA